MRYAALATDFDGTLAHDGRVSDEAVEALKALRKSGRKIILVTGRLIKSLRSEFPPLDLFDLIVAENGGILYEPASKESTRLADPPQERLVAALRERGVAPLEIGEVIVSTWEPHEMTVVDVIRDLGLERQVIFNKGAVMTLPSGINKATGLQAALDRFDLSAHNVAGVGDAENDHAFLQLSELSAAVANALPAVHEAADVNLAGDHGLGVAQLARELLDNDGAAYRTKRDRTILLGRSGETSVAIEPHSSGVTLIAGESGSGKSTLATGVVERILERGYQVCIVDPEGDYDAFEGVVTIGDPDHAPAIEEVVSLLRRPAQSLAVNLLGIPIDARAEFAAQLVPALTALRAKTGRPHWIVLDEAHHLARKERGKNTTLPADAFNVLAITTRAALLSEDVRSAVQTVIAVGRGHAALWRRGEHRVTFVPAPPKATLRRHRRKYAAGDLAPEKSFYFRGKDGKLNLRAQNLNTFAQIAEGVDDETWMHHLRRGDVATWFEQTIGDGELAEHARDAARSDASESRKAIVEEIHKRYTLSA